jgi:hypothetical protein
MVSESPLSYESKAHCAHLELKTINWKAEASRCTSPGINIWIITMGIVIANFLFNVVK